MKRITTIFIVLLVGLFHVSSAQNWTGINSSHPVAADVHLIESTIDQTRIQFTVDGFSQKFVNTPQGRESIITVDNGVLITEKGMPDLAKLYTTIIIPDTDEMEVKIVSSSYQEFENIAVAPSKGHFTRDIRPEDVPFVYGDVYNEDAFWPGDLAQLEDPFIMRDFRGQTVTIFPYQYNPFTQTLRVYTDIVVEVVSTGKEGLDPKTRTRDYISMVPEFGHIYHRFFLNMSAADKSYQVLEGEEGSLLIIAYDSFMEAMVPFVNWKRQTGRKTVMVSRTEAGNTAAGIKAYVQNYYDENPDFAHLLLVGDAPTQMPVGQASGGQSDNWYGFLEGNNSYNDIFVGRFSAETVAHVETQVQRMIEYERDLDESDTWLAKGMGIARNEGTGSGHNGENDYHHMDFIRDTLLNYTYDEVLKRYDGNVPGVPNTNAAQMSADFNEGIGIVNFCNHGSVTGWSVANYSITHVNQLTNVGMLPFIWSVACVNGAFVNAFCFAEAWLRATHEGQPTGAIGMMAATINQPWQPPMTGQDEMVTLLAEQSIFPGINTYQRTFGGISINGSMAMIPAHGASGISTHQTWILFGDPTLKVRTDTPEAFDISYNPVILIGTEEFEVSIADAEGATVALTYYDEMDEEVIIVGTAIVEDGAANISFDVDIEEPMNLTLTATGFNKVTYINEAIEVIPPDGPYVVLDYYTINHETGTFVYGTEASIDITVKNVGIEDADNVTGTIVMDDPYFTLVSADPVTFGEVLADDENNTATVTNAFTLQLADNVPDQYRANAILVLNDGELQWESNIRFTAAAPVLVFEEMTIEGTLNEGILDPGDVADLIIQVRNLGHAAVQDVAVTATSESTWLTLSGEPVLEVLEPGEADAAVFTISAADLTPPETAAQIDFEAVAGAYTAEDSREIIIGQAPVYDLGDIPSTYNTSPTTASNAEQPGVLTVTIPENATVTSVTVEYSMTSHGGAWMSEQRSFVRCVSEGGTTEPQVYSGANNSAGVFDYHRTGLDIANNVEGGGEIVFELHPFRTWGGSGTNTQYVFVNNNTWKVIVYYEMQGHSVGFVVADSEGNQIEGAVITLDGVTNAPGDYVFTNLMEGVYDYTVTKYAYETVTGTVEMEEEDVTVEVEMTALPTYDAIFQVVDFYGNDLHGATIVINEHEYAAGHYHIDYLVADTYTYSVHKENHYTVEGEFTIEDDHVEIGVMLKEMGYEVIFHITDQDGAELHDATVSIEELTFDAGIYHIVGLSSGLHSYVVTKEDYRDRTGSFMIINNNIELNVVLELHGTDVADLAQAGIQAFPNPFSHELTLELKAAEVVDIQMFDMLGNQVYGRKQVTGSQTLQLDHLPTGNYFVRITGTQGSEIIKVSKVK